MPKATAVLADGTRVTIEGSPEELATVLQRLSGSQSPSGSKASVKQASVNRPDIGGSGGGRTQRRNKSSKGPAEHIRRLVAEGFFKVKRGIADVQSRLEERAHIYPVTHLSPVLFRLVKGRELRRIKVDGAWQYVNP